MLLAKESQLAAGRQRDDTEPQAWLVDQLAGEMEVYNNSTEQSD